ncbi:MAG: selenide, water dikinase SelD [Proteobacteria bacterium]|nr:selenide, water dikinase SelD [Pseudomonadota bacterium]
MKTDNTPIVKDLVLIGGGHSHVIVLKRFAMKPLPGVRITLICRDVETPYSGMLPGLVAGHYTRDDVHIDLGPLARFANARFYHDEAIGLDLKARTVHTVKRPPVPYDVLSIDIGSTPYMADVPGAAENVVAVKPISNFFDRWQELVRRIETSAGSLSIAIVGAGAGGTEMLLAMQYGLQRRLRQLGHDPNRLHFHLFSAQDVPLPTHAPKVQQAFLRVCHERGIEVHLNARVQSVDGKILETSDGATYAIDETLWVTHASAQSWLGDAGLEIHGNGFIAVNETLESVSHRGVFGVGDCAAVLAHPREKAGVFAVRQGPALERNLRRALRGQVLKRFVPQKNFLSLISTGDRYAVATRGGSLMFEGAWVWRWKDWIDRRFMRKFSDLPAMHSGAGVHLATGLADTQVIEELSEVAMRCGGCGAKIGASVLTRVLNDLKPAARADVLIGLHEPDDAAVITVPANKVVVQTVDSFRAMLDDPYLFGKIAANHALGDIFAMGAEPQSALAIATLPFGIESKVEDTLRQMMSGAMEILADANTALVGGHTSEGVELSLGFAINGLIDADAILRKGGMRAGDALIVSKALGTGTLFAADMRHKARGRWISAAIESMVQSNRYAARCLFEHHATSCTDVTGFGLLGHLVEMVKASRVDVTLEMQAIPVMDGALETVAMGITSSLEPQNLRLRRAIKNLAAVTSDPRYALLFDPQTAGGLLASVPQHKAADCVQALKALGYKHSAVIGRVLPQSDALEPITIIA